MRGKTLVGGTIVKTTFQTCNFHYWPQNNPLLYCVLEILSCNFAGYGINLIEDKFNPINHEERKVPYRVSTYS